MEENTLLQVKNFKLSFKMEEGINHVIRDISFHVKKGETLAIVGESGSGKSVTAKAIMGMIDGNGRMDSGTIEFRLEDEVLDLAKLDEKGFQKKIRGNKIAMIFQDPMTSLDPTMTIGKQIMEGMLLHNIVDTKEAAKKKTIKLLNKVGIDLPEKRFKQYPHQLSGGMRQRVVIAIALACEPELLIADEPTTALDVTIQAQILDLIKKIQRDFGVSIIFITHDLGVVANVADRVAVMYAGQIVEEGLTDEVFYNPKHPYTWGLLSSIPVLSDDKETEIYSIPGTPPNLIKPPLGDAFAYRSVYAMDIDFEQEAPMFEVTDTHRVKSWLMDSRAPHVEMPKLLQERLKGKSL